MLVRMYTSRLSFHRTALRFPLTHVTMSPTFHFQRFRSNIPWHFTSVMANCSTCIDFTLEQIVKQSRRSEVIIHKNLVSQSLNSSNYLQHSSVCRCYFSCCMLLLLAQINTNVISVSQRVTKFVNFDAKSFTFLWNILLKNHPSFIQHDDFIHGKVFCWTVHFTKFVVQNVKNLSYFPQSTVVWVITAWRVVIVFKMEESYNVEKAVARHHI